MKTDTDPKKIEEVLTRGVQEVIDKDHLQARLAAGKPLRVKLGIDPTSPHLHLGRSIPLLKLRDFQQLGHQVVLIIGDGTGVIGDTSDKDAERPMLDKKTLAANMKTYAKQAGKIIDLKKCEIRHNADWLDKLRYAEIGEQADQFSLHEMIMRENIRRRLDADKRISLRELLYPLMQGYDSVAVKSDVELGGTDQRFNLLAGRELQRHYGQEPQDIVMNPLIEGTDGRKMSSSWQNAINLTDAADEMFGKVMSLHDDLIEKYFIHVTRVSMDEIAQIREMANPRDQKTRLAKEIVAMYHGPRAADAAANRFDEIFRRHLAPEDVEIFKVTRNPYPILDLLCDSGLAESKKDAKRVLEGGGVEVAGQKISDWRIELPIKDGMVIQFGKRKFVKIMTK